MYDYCVPLSQPSPDAQAFIRCLTGEQTPERPPLVEYLIDEVLMRPILAEMMGREWVEPQPDDRSSQIAYWDNFIEFWYRMGYDFVRLELSLGFTHHHLFAEDTAPESVRQRSWADEHRGTITSWDDFERYPWPTVTDEHFFAHEYVVSHLPAGMGLISNHGGGICEWLTWMMSYEGLCLALYDAPDLVAAVAQRIGALMEQYYKRLLQLDGLIAVFPGDDMGFRTQTLIGPDALREYCLPWHQRFAQMAHQAGVLYLLHSCGNVEAIMEDLVEDVGIDGKHSFEDVIIPISQFQQRYGDRIAVLGGVDVHNLATCSPDQLRRYVREVIDECAPRGRFAVGSGNSIPSYIPVENYLTMLDEALR